MANPKHVKIVKAGRKALDDWWYYNDQPYPGQVTLDLSDADLEGIALPRVSFKQADLKGANLEKAMLLGSNFESALLTGANLKKANLIKAGFNFTSMDGVNLEGANCGGTTFCFASLKNAMLRNAYLSGANFERADLSGSNLTGAELYGTGFCDAKLEDAILDGIRFHLTVTERWVIKKVKCTHFFLLSPETFKNGKMWKRIPQKGNLEPSEFENRIKYQAKLIAIEATNFNKSKSFKLLERIIADAGRKGVPCEDQLFRSLKENLKKHAYSEVAKSLKRKSGRAFTTIPVGMVTIIY